MSKASNVMEAMNVAREALKTAGFYLADITDVKEENGLWLITAETLRGGKITIKIDKNGIVKEFGTNK